jgi:tRNA A-37 threonylcarbamoyl transferase component Bud32
MIYFLCCFDSWQLLEELSLIHEHGVVYGDLRASNTDIVLQNGTDPHFIDFSHGYQHHYTGRATCSELRAARKFLLLDTAHLV